MQKVKINVNITKDNQNAQTIISEWEFIVGNSYSDIIHLKTLKAIKIFDSANFLVLFYNILYVSLFSICR